MKTASETRLLGISLKQAPRTFQPFGDRVLLERAKADEVTAGGIILPANADGSEKINVSVVRAIGDAVTTVAVGDWVMHLPYATESVAINGSDFGVCRVDDLLGRLVQ